MCLCLHLAGSDSSRSRMSTLSVASCQQDILMCDVCLEAYDENTREPKFLTCHHSFCLSCLSSLTRDHTTIECPTCRQPTSLPANGVQGLQTNFYVMSMKDLLKQSKVTSSDGCVNHTNQTLSFFCRLCMVAICRDCTVLDHRENEGHVIQDINQADKEQRAVLKNEIFESRKILSVVEGHINCLEAEIDNLNFVREEALGNIDKVFQSYATMLEARKTVLINEIMDFYVSKKDLLFEEIQEMRKEKEYIVDMKDKCEVMVKSGRLMDIVASKSDMLNKLGEIKTKIEEADPGNNYMKMDEDQGMQVFQESLKCLGKVKIEDALPSCVKFDFQDQKLMSSSVAFVKVQLFSCRGEKLNASYPVTVEITDPNKVIIENKQTVEDEAYRVEFQPQIPGTHTFVAKLRHRAITGSIREVQVQSNNPIQTIGDRGEGHGLFLHPRAVAVDNDGNIFVADTGNFLIQKFDPDGTFLHQFKITDGDTEYSTCDLVLQKSTNTVVCTETHIGPNINPTMGNTVVMYNTNGFLKRRFVNKAMRCALCVAVNSQGHIIVSDYLAHCLFKYDQDGNFLGRIGQAGSKSGQFTHPAFIAIGRDDRIIVSDTNNDCVQVFDSDGLFLYKFGQHGTKIGEFKQPFGVATDDDHIIVVDSGNQRVQVFKSDGTFVSVIDSADSPMGHPRGITVSEPGFILVADRDNHCIKKYRYL